MEILFSGTHLRLGLNRTGGRKLVVTFDPRDKNRRDFPVPRVSDRYAGAGFDQLHLSTRRPDWFINDDTSAVEAEMRALTDAYDHIVLFGFSMGGFGALRFADACRADHLLLVSPFWSMDPDIVPLETRFPEDLEFVRSPNAPIPLDRAAKVRGAILVDPWHVDDMRQAKCVQAHFPQLRITRVAGSGHPASQLLRDAGRAAVVLDAACQDSPDFTKAQALHRQLRGKKPAYQVARQTRTKRREATR